MNNTRETSAKRRRFILRVRQLRKKLKQTQEEVFLENAITMLKAGDDSAAAENLRCCLKSLNLTQGEVVELKMVIKHLAKSEKANVYDLFHWLITLWDSMPMENKFSLVVSVLKFFFEKPSSIYFYSYECKYYISRPS